MTNFNLTFSADITEGRRFPVRIIFRPVPLVPTDDVIKYLEKTPQNAKKLRNVEVMDVCAASLVGVPTGGQLFFLFYMRKINYYIFKKAEE